MSATAAPVAAQAAPPLAVPFGAWEPDVASVDAGVAALATNVFAQANGYGPVPSPNPVTLPLPGVCRGAISVRTRTGSWIAYAGTATKLYRLDPGTLGWQDVSGPSPYLLPEGDYWSFALYGPTLIAAHTGAPPQEIDINTGAAFADLAHTPGYPPPAARFVVVVSEFVVLGGLLDDEETVQWSSIGDPHEWVPGVHSGDVQTLPDGGRVTGLVGGDSTIVFQGRAIQTLVFAAGTPEVFQRTKLESDRGAVAPWSVIKVGATIFFLDREGFFAFAGGASVAIGSNRVNRWFQALRDPTYVHTCVTAPDPTGQRVFWAFKSKNSADPTRLDLCIVYDFALDRWTRVDLSIRYWLRVQTAPITLDSITEDVDAGTGPYDFADGLSLDSALFSGGIPITGVFGLDGRLSLLEGPSLEAVIETPFVQVARPRRAFCNGMRVDTDAPDWRVKVSTRESLAADAAIRERPESMPNAERFACCRASGRYHRATARIPAAQAWTYAQAVEPDFEPEGMR